MKKWMIWICGVLLMLGSAPRLCAADEAAVTNVILISWDGVDRSVLKELMKAGTLTNLAALAQAGSIQDIDVQGHATETLPGHAEMFTGLSADLTGVRDNSNRGPVPDGSSIMERLEGLLGTNQLASILVVAKKKVGALFASAPEKMDLVDAADRMAADTGVRIMAALEKYGKRRFLAVFHFQDPDVAGHARGSGSKEYRKATALCDAWLGQIMEWLRKQELDRQTLIYVMADHGFDANARVHSDAPDIWLVTNDPAVKRGGTIADIPATIMKRFGVNLDEIDPRLLGQPLE